MNRKALGVIASVYMGLGFLAAAPVAAQESSDWEISGNVAVTNNYIYRGYTQTDGDFAIQGGMDVGHSSGFYAGFWASNVDFLDQSEDGSDDTSIEVDVYAGYAGDFGNSMFSYDVGVLYYAYPGATPGSDYDFVEFGLTLGADLGAASVSAAIWYSPDFFGGIGDAIHIPVGIEVPIPIGNGGSTSLSASANVGFNKYIDLDYKYINWDIGMTISVEEWFDVDLRYYDTDEPAMYCKNICDGRFVAAVSRTF